MFMYYNDSNETKNVVINRTTIILDIWFLLFQDLIKNLQVFEHQEELAKKEHVLESKNLDTTSSDNHDIHATSTESEVEMASKVQILHKI